jgi:hypothetical protein
MPIFLLYQDKFCVLSLAGLHVLPVMHNTMHQLLYHSNESDKTEQPHKVREAILLLIHRQWGTHDNLVPKAQENVPRQMKWCVNVPL